MNKRKRMIVSLGCALLCMLSCLLYARHVEHAAERARVEALERYGGEVVSLVVANRTLEAGETVSAGDVELREWIASLAPSGAHTKMDEVVGRQISVPLVEGAPLTTLNFRETGEAIEVPSGHVAVAVPITDQLGVSASVPVGTKVIAYQVSADATQLIGGNATVLSSPGSRNATAGRSTITIAVAPADVRSILAASALGDLRLVMPADDVRELAEGVATVDVLPVDSSKVAAVS